MTDRLSPEGEAAIRRGALQRNQITVRILLKEIDALREEMEMIMGVREVMDDATIAAVYLTQELRIATLEADLAHARYLANGYAEAVWGTVGYTAPGSPASDGWVPGTPVPS